MTESSIVVKVTDQYSEVVKKMSAVSKALTKDVGAMEYTLDGLSRNKGEAKKPPPL